MITRRRALLVWLGGLSAFVVAMALHMPLTLATVPQGIVSHQTAGTAQRVDYIQQQWLEAGVYANARTAMIADFFFILLFGLGALLAGLYLRSRPGAPLRMLGTVTVVAALVFLATDLTETVLQFAQLLDFRGDDTMAAIAAAMHYPKLVSWLACFILPLNGFVLDWARRGGRDPA